MHSSSPSRSRREKKTSRGSPPTSGAMGFAVSSIGGQGTEIIFPVSTGRRGKHNVKVQPLNSEDDELVRRVLMKAGGRTSGSTWTSLGAPSCTPLYQHRDQTGARQRRNLDGVVDSTSCTSESSDASDSASSNSSYSSSGEWSPEGPPHRQRRFPSDGAPPNKPLRRYQLSGTGVRTRAAPEQESAMQMVHPNPPSSQWVDNNGGPHRPAAGGTARRDASQRQWQPLPAATPKSVDGSGPGFFIRSGVVHAMWRDTVTPSVAGLVPPLQQQQQIVLRKDAEALPVPTDDAAVNTSFASHHTPQRSAADVAVNTSFASHPTHRSPSHASNPSAADVGVNTSFGTKRSGGNMLQASFDSIGNQRSAITSPSIRPQPAPSQQPHAATTTATRSSPPPAGIEGIPFVKETAASTPQSRSSSPQSPATPQPPQSTAVEAAASPLSRPHAKSSGALRDPQTPQRAPSLPPTLNSPHADASIVMASSTRSVLLSPPVVPQYAVPAVRQQSSPRMQEERPRVAWEQQAQHVASSPDMLPAASVPLAGAGAGSGASPGDDGGAMEEYVVPLGRIASSATKRDGNLNPLRSYSHRSLFRPPREDVEAVRQLSTSASFAGTAASPQRVGGGEQGSPDNISRWC